ncbi:MAG: MAPEG family protein [Chroococcales cyanobacterium]
MNLASSAILLYAIAIAGVLIYLPFFAVGYARAKVGYDISAPRAMFDKLPPYAKRANWAHQNSFEAFILFAPAALMAYVTGVDSTIAAGAAITFVIVRSLYSLFYILDIPYARSFMFGIGSLCSFTLYGLSIAILNNSH